jgi:hypothetical protein
MKTLAPILPSLDGSILEAPDIKVRTIIGTIIILSNLINKSPKGLIHKIFS